MKENKRFNRRESLTEHYYYNDFGYRKTENQSIYNGYVKCKLVHKEQFSLIIVDLFCIENDMDLLWFQPLAFTANHLYKDKDVIYNYVAVDVSCGNNARLEFRNIDYIKSYPDGSQLHRCQIHGASDLKEYSTGHAYKDENNNLLIKLYHHTKVEFGKLIEAGSKFKLSTWNIQGTKANEKKGFLYFTALDNVRTNGDLIQIAMSSDGKIYHMTDGDDLSNFANYSPLKFYELYRHRVLQLKVYRENSTNRNYKMNFYVASHLLSPQHIYKHFLADTGIYYEICKPFIYRICCADKNDYITFKDSLIFEVSSLHSSNYIIMGDCSTKDGLAAPYNEDDTAHIFKIEHASDLSVLDFWFTYSNSDLFSDKFADLEMYVEPK